MIHNRFSAHAFALLGALALSACTSMGGGYGGMREAMPAKKAADGTLTNAAGMTLYTFDKDAGGQERLQRTVRGELAAARWRPADAKAMGDWSIVTRDDGRQAVGVQRQAALHVDEGPEARRQDRRRLAEQRVARREGLTSQRAQA